jgi:succinate dehydrogenase / fumarate reductase cytochrome b subunit
MSQLETSAPPGNRVGKTFPRKDRRRPFFVEFYASPVGKKWVMALTGLMLLGFVLVHMIGNLHLYEGPLEINEYGEALRDLGGALIPREAVLWGMRIGLIGAFALHIHSALALTRINQKARPDKYQGGRDYIAANFASRTMRWTGIIVGLFVLYHLADLTLGWTNPDYIEGNVYHNVVESLSNPIVAAFYILANVALAFHIYHGAWSMFQSLGINSPRYNSWRRGFAGGFALIILIGNLSFPIAVQLGLVEDDARDEIVEELQLHEADDTDEGIDE